VKSYDYPAIYQFIRSHGCAGVRAAYVAAFAGCSSGDLDRLLLRIESRCGLLYSEERPGRQTYLYAVEKDVRYPR